MNAVTGVLISLDDLSDPQVVALLEGHVAQMREVSPPESVHALDVEALRAPAITFWAARDGDEVVGCVALKRLDDDHVELKSMRTLPSRLRQGIAGQLLRHAVNEAREAGYKRISLETGSEDFFEPARSLYARYGFLQAEPFADYTHDPNSAYFTLQL
ncbi:putative acetyltransferase [Kineosporia succinea]|uniref:Acetyltransferase n=1 Tax=Kineosporia succinea TaxID=84632 RepID=A0ABT9PB99_9ACTN|nr:GNAT family N-acetyltransferase [Kineosporia succinea]MDP9829977.1 putative acetyltransferase [Kineosporia succinea]